MDLTWPPIYFYCVTGFYIDFSDYKSPPLPGLFYVIIPQPLLFSLWKNLSLISNLLTMSYSKREKVSFQQLIDEKVVRTFNGIEID